MDLIEVFPNLFLFPSTLSLGFSYLLVRPDGNLLVPSGLYSSELSALINLIDGKGGVTAVLACCKNNVKEESAAAQLCTNYGVPLYIGANDARGNMIAPGDHVHPLRLKETAIYSDVDFIPLPGYTSGSSGYLWRSDGKAYLFIGVTLAHADGVWKVWTRKVRATNCIDSFVKMKNLDYDVLLLNSFSNTLPTWFEWSSVEKKAVLDQAIAQVTAMS